MTKLKELTEILDELIQQEFLFQKYLDKYKDNPPCIHDSLDSLSHSIHCLNEYL